MAGTPPATIDLGVYSYRAGPERVPERPWPFWVWSRRWWPVVLMAVLVWPLAGAAVPPEPPLVPLWTGPDGADVAVADTDLYAVTSNEDGLALTAYGLVDGSLRWETPLDVPGGPAWPSGPHQTSVDQISVDLVDGLLLVQNSSVPAFTAVYDAATAELRWSGEGYPEVLGAGLVALHTAGDSLDPYLADTEIRELDSGAVVMSFGNTTERFARPVAPDGTLQLVGLDRDGRLTSYDLATGRVLHRVSTPHEEPLEASDQNYVTTLGDLVLVHAGAGGATELAAYDRVTLAPVWTVSGGMQAESCGALMCVVTEGRHGQPIALQGIDPATGAARWAASCPVGGAWDCVLAATQQGPGGRVFVRWSLFGGSPDESVAEGWIIDTATGRRLAGPTGWWPVAQSDSGWLLRRSDEDSTWWARADWDLARVEVLGEAEAGWCAPHDPYLVCHTPDRQAKIWRFSA